MNLFLQSAPVFDQAAFENAIEGAAGGAAVGGILAVIMAFLAIFIVLGLILYIYMSLAFMAIAKKAKYPSPGLAWIPMIGPALIASKTANMHWWPILLLLGGFIPVVGNITGLAFAIFFVIWMWKTFEAVGKPGWWAIFQVIPLLNIVWFIFIGIAAWSGEGEVTPIKSKSGVKKSKK